MCKEIVQERPPFDVAWQIIDGLKVRYATGGSGGERVMLLSPWPESIFAFAPVWVGLAKQFNVLAIDLPSFGRSEARDALFAPQKMGAAQLVRRIASRYFTYQWPDSANPTPLGSRPTNGGRRW